MLVVFEEIVLFLPWIFIFLQYFFLGRTSFKLKAATPDLSELDFFLRQVLVSDLFLYLLGFFI